MGFLCWSLLLGFTLTLAAARFVERRSLLIDESISIRTAYLRAVTLPQPYRDHSRKLFQQYVDARLDLDNAGLNTAQVVEASNRSKSIHEELWTDAAAVAELKPTSVTTAYINSLNQTIDLHEKPMAAYEKSCSSHYLELDYLCVGDRRVYPRLDAGLSLLAEPCARSTYDRDCRRSDRRSRFPKPGFYPT